MILQLAALSLILGCQDQLERRLGSDLAAYAKLCEKGGGASLSDRRAAAAYAALQLSSPRSLREPVIVWGRIGLPKDASVINVGFDWIGANPDLDGMELSTPDGYRALVTLADQLREENRAAARVSVKFTSLFTLDLGIPDYNQLANRIGRLPVTVRLIQNGRVMPQGYVLESRRGEAGHR